MEENSAGQKLVSVATGISGNDGVEQLVNRIGARLGQRAKLEDRAICLRSRADIDAASSLVTTTKSGRVVKRRSFDEDTGEETRRKQRSSRGMVCQLYQRTRSAAHEVDEKPEKSVEQRKKYRFHKMAHGSRSLPLPIAAGGRSILEQLTDIGGGGDVLLLVLSNLSLPQLLQASQVCKLWAETAEALFQAECKRRGWTQPRHPRGLTRHVVFSWRNLYSKHACRSCGRRGEFPARCQYSNKVAPLKLVLCRPCINKPTVQQRLVQENLYVDLIGVSGKKLLPWKGKRRP